MAPGLWGILMKDEDFYFSVQSHIYKWNIYICGYSSHLILTKK